MKEKEIKGEQGVCWKCQYYDSYANYCDYFKIYLNGDGIEPTCNNPELKKSEKK